MGFVDEHYSRLLRALVTGTREFGIQQAETSGTSSPDSEGAGRNARDRLAQRSFDISTQILSVHMKTASIESEDNSLFDSAKGEQPQRAAGVAGSDVRVPSLASVADDLRLICEASSSNDSRSFGMSNQSQTDKAAQLVLISAVAAMHAHTIQQLLDTVLPLSIDIDYWNSQDGGIATLAMYLAQSLPWRLYEWGCRVTVAAMKLPESRAASVSQIRFKISKLVDAQNTIAEMIGVLSQVAVDDGLSPGRSPPTVEIVVAQVIDILRSMDHSESTHGIDVPAPHTGILDAAQLTGRLAEMIQTISARFTHRLHRYRRPSLVERSWIPAIVFIIGARYLSSFIAGHQDDFKEWLRDGVVTLQNYISQYILEPLRSAYETIRYGKHTYTVVTDESLLSDFRSLEDMVVGFARRFGNVDAADVRQRVEAGDLSDVMSVYAREMQQPFKNAVFGDLVEAMLIQVQKVKVDVGQTMAALDKLLKSNELNFLLLSTVPATLSLYAAGRWVFSKVSWWIGGGSRFTVSSIQVVVRDIDRLLNAQDGRSSEGEDSRADAVTQGQLICYTHYLRHHAQILPNAGSSGRVRAATGWVYTLPHTRSMFLQDIRDIESASFTGTQKRNVLEPRSEYDRMSAILHDMQNSDVLSLAVDIDMEHVKLFDDARTPYLTKQWRRYMAVHHIPKPILITILAIVSAFSYVLSLQGGSLVYINEHLSIIGFELVVSVLSLTAITVMLYASRMRQGTRQSTLLLVSGICVVMYTYDHGERFEHHGFYNILVFLAIYVPLNLAIAVFYMLWCKIENFLVYFAVAVAVGGVSTGMTLVHYRRVFDIGLLGRFEYIPGECQWVGRNIPYIDLLPAGTQNFWAGPSHCKSEPLDIAASIRADGILSVECNNHGLKDVYVDILPETRTWPLQYKDMWHTYNHLVLKKIIRLPYNANTSFVLDSKTQAVVVRCGSSSKIVTRVSPSYRDLPNFVPPSDSDTRISQPSLGPTVTPAVFDAVSSLQAERKRPNVIFLMIDAVSRRQFFRRLPKSANIMRTLERPGNHRIFELFRYHSVGFSTDNNTRAMYTGDILPVRRNPLPIWAYYRDRGYVTARVETGCDDWTKEYVGRNFDNKLFSVGNRSLDYELTSPFCLPEYFPDTGNPFGNFKGPYSMVARCLYGRYVHEWAFDYLTQLRREFRSADSGGADGQGYQRKPYMISATFLEGHEGTGEVLSTLDDSLSDFIGSMRDSGELEDTVLIVGADHGLHMGLNFAFLQNGRIEHQNPFMALSIPEWLYRFAEEYQNEYGAEKISPFETNAQRLTTPLETHYTFRVLADWPRFDVESWRRSLFATQKAVGQAQDGESASMEVRISVFISTLSTVFCGLLVACAIGLDAAVRYGLRSFGLARLLSNYYEVGCFFASVVISQTTLYAFGEIRWTGSATVVQGTGVAVFDVLVWASESAWILLSTATALLFVGYALVKANKIARYNSSSTNASMESVLGSAPSIQGRVYVSIGYVVVFAAAAGFKIGFRASGSQSTWLLRMASICEALQAEILLVAFLVDLAVNISRRPEWLSASASSSMETMLDKEVTGNKSFTGWRKSRFVEWHKGFGTVAETKDSKLGMPVGRGISRCYIHSTVSYCESDDYSMSNVSFETVPEWCTQSMVMYPHTA
ncbi:hypothetical protein GGI15_000402 [Coemansia interrupta]|uniref:Uncharacterized protein n=1 Tax=Coemansia interrupta TaxID=1126814 RepID=A0A9W8LNJ5_9FUNG|nr:hypothetical protein GGI15_000402 [Coemansia interrupta]